MAGQLASDPSYLAYMRALGFEESTATGDAQFDRDTIERKQAAAIPELEYQGGVQREQLAGGFEDRGLLRSGMHEQAQARLMHDQGYQRSQLDMAHGDALAEIERNLQRQLGDIERRRSEQTLSSGAGTYLSTGLAPYGGGL
jgi:hypothetical protein